jgi:hypothetical protein
LTIQTNDDSLITCVDGQDIATCSADTLNGLAATTQPVTITETQPNTGTFTSYDESDVSAIKTTDAAARGTSGTIDYNETPVSIVIGFGWADIDIQPIDD